MEFALPELLSREDILRILQQRQLPIQGMNELTHEELLRVYKTFVMPLSKRPERSKRIKQVTTYESAEKSIEYVEEPMNTIGTLMDVDESPVVRSDGGPMVICQRMCSPVGEKRRQRSSDDDYLDMMVDDYQYQLSSVTKRIRINSLS